MSRSTLRGFAAAVVLVSLAQPAWTQPPSPEASASLAVAQSGGGGWIEYVSRSDFFYAVTVVDYSHAERLNAERAKNCPPGAQSACTGSVTMGVGSWIVDVEGAPAYAIRYPSPRRSR